MLDYYLEQIADIDEALLGLKAEKQDLDITTKTLVANRENLAQKAANLMIESGCTSADVQGVRWSIRNTPAKVIVTDERLIPPKFFKEKVTKALDKTLLKAALKDRTIQGAELSNGSITLVAKGIV